MSHPVFPFFSVFPVFSYLRYLRLLALPKQNTWNASFEVQTRQHNIRTIDLRWFGRLEMKPELQQTLSRTSITSIQMCRRWDLARVRRTSVSAHARALRNMHSHTRASEKPSSLVALICTKPSQLTVSNVETGPHDRFELCFWTCTPAV